MKKQKFLAKKWKFSAKNARYKKEPNEDFRTEKYNSQIQKLSGWAPYQNRGQRGKNLQT